MGKEVCFWVCHDSYIPLFVLLAWASTCLNLDSCRVEVVPGLRLIHAYVTDAAAGWALLGSVQDASSKSIAGAAWTAQFYTTLPGSQASRLINSVTDNVFVITLLCVKAILLCIRHGKSLEL